MNRKIGKECSKCKKKSSSLTRIYPNNEFFKCGLCKDYESGWGDKDPFASSDNSNCSCPAICWDCRQKQCGRCGNVKGGYWGDEFAANCKICKRINMLEKIDRSDTDGEGNWVDSRGQIIASCEECIDCGMKTVCRDCAFKKQRITDWKNCEKCHKSWKLTGTREWINNWKTCKECIQREGTQTSQNDIPTNHKPTNNSSKKGLMCKNCNKNNCPVLHGERKLCDECYQKQRSSNQQNTSPNSPDNSKNQGDNRENSENKETPTNSSSNQTPVSPNEQNNQSNSSNSDGGKNSDNKPDSNSNNNDDTSEIEKLQDRIKELEIECQCHLDALEIAGKWNKKQKQELQEEINKLKKELSERGQTVKDINIRQYFQENNIKKITREGDNNLKVEFNDGHQETWFISANDSPEKKGIANFFQKNGQKSLEYSQLINSQDKKLSAKTNNFPYWIFIPISLFLVAVVVAIFICRRKRKNKKMTLIDNRSQLQK